MENSTAKKIASKLKSKRGILAVYLFGSCAKGKNSPVSDVDLAVFLDGRVKGAAQDALSYSSSKIDISIFNESPPYLKFEVMEGGKALFVRDKKRLEAMLVSALKEYHDHVGLYKRFGLIRVGA